MVLKAGGVLAQRDEQAAPEGEQHQGEPHDLHDVLRRQEIADKQAERGEQQGPEPNAESGDDPHLHRHGRLAGEHADHIDGEDRGRSEHQRCEHLDHDVRRSATAV